MFIKRAELYSYITQQELEQFEAMNPDCIDTAYRHTVGYIVAEIGHIWDIDGMLQVRGDERNLTLQWLVSVVMAYKICSVGVQVAEPLEMEYKMAIRKIYELKGSQISFDDAPRKGEPNALGKIVSTRYKEIG